MPRDESTRKPVSCDDEQTFVVDHGDPSEGADSEETIAHEARGAEDEVLAGQSVRLPSRYRVQGRLGRGGMGIVLDAADLVFRRDVAVKILREGRDSQSARARFIAEAQIQGQLDHPAICPIHELGTDDVGRPWFSMKRVRGRGLGEWISARTVGDADELGEMVDVFARVCEAMAFAHARGVIHRDLKPENVMVGAYGEVHVMDWGLAHIAGADAEDDVVTTARSEHSAFHSLDGTVLGTPAYMAPEQAKGLREAIDHRTDVFALGAILYAILTGSPPHQSSDASTTTARAAAGVIERPSLRAPHLSVPADLEAIAMKALRVDPVDRYDSAEALLDEIRRWRAGRSVHAARYTPVQRLVRWFRLRPRATAAFATAALALLVVVGFGLWRGQQQRQHERAAWLARLNALDVALLEARDALERVRAVDFPPLVRPNGETDGEAAESWYTAHEGTLSALEALARHHASAPAGELSRRIDLAANLVERRALSRSAALQATTIGDHGLARAFVSRQPGSKDALLKDVALRRREGVDADLAVVEGLLERAQDPERMGGDFLDFAATTIGRLGRPAVVRRLLRDVEAVDEWRRRLVIESLGRIGDTRTKSDEGQDAVEVLLKRLDSLEIADHLVECVAIVRALGILGDGRAHDPVSAKRWSAGQTSPFWARTAVAMERLPVPAGLVLDDPDDYFDRAMRLDAMGDLEAAIRDYTQAIEAGMKTDDPWVNRGVLHLRTGNPEASIADHTRALEIRPGNQNALYNRGNARAALSQWKKALSDYEAALKAAPQMVEAHCGRARANEALGRTAAAKEDLDRALEIQPDNVVALNNRGLWFYRRGDPVSALRDYDRVIAIRPEGSMPWVNRGRILLDRGDLDGAIASFDQALRLDPSSTYGYVNRAEAHRKAGRLERALADNDRAVSLGADIPVLRRERARTRQAAGDLTGAIADLDDILERNPKDGESLGLRGQLRYLTGDEAGALDDLNALTKLWPDSALAWNSRGQIFQASGRAEEAEEDFERCLRLTPNDAVTWLRLGRVRIALEDVDGAVEALGKAIALVEDMAAARALRGELLLESDRASEAAEDLAVAVRMLPDDASLRVLLARAFVRRATDATLRRDHGLALDELDEAYDLGHEDFSHADFAPLRAQSRFKELFD